MKPRFLLPSAIGAVAVITVSLFMCRKPESADDAQTSAKPKPAPVSSPFKRNPVADSSAPPPAEKKAVPAENKTVEEVKPLTPEEEEKKAVSMAGTMFKWMTAYGLDHGMRFPADTSALVTKGYGFPIGDAGEWLGRVIDYRGRDYALSDSADLVLMRYRINGVPDKEVRLMVGGATVVVPVSDPIPEDAPPPAGE